MTDQLLLWWAKLEVLWRPLAIGAGVLVLVVVVVVSQIRFVRDKRRGP